MYDTRLPAKASPPWPPLRSPPKSCRSGYHDIPFRVTGKHRGADGYDETVLEGERGASSDTAGFEHPYGRGSVPAARVVALSPDALAQVPVSAPQACGMSTSEAYSS